MRKPLAVLALALGAAAAAGSASASQWPGSIVGTWAARTGTTAAQLSIVSQDNGTPCAAIGGSMTDAPSGTAETIEGFYCPDTGRIVFTRRAASAATAYGSYIGNLSAGGPTLFIGGTFAQDQDGGPIPVGEYNFHAQK